MPKLISGGGTTSSILLPKQVLSGSSNYNVDLDVKYGYNPYSFLLQDPTTLIETGWILPGR